MIYAKKMLSGRNSRRTLSGMANTLPLLLLLIIQACSSSSNLQEQNARELATSGEASTIQAVEEDYRITPGDEIEILVWEQPSFNTQATVSWLGTIAIPLIGEKQIVGMTREELQRELVRDLSRYITGEVNLTVSIRNISNMQVSVYGMVTRPDNYPVNGQTSLFKVLSYAGGPAEEANIRSVRIYRRGSSTNSTIDLTRYLEDGNLESPAVMVDAGDVIYVPRKENAVREMSDFLRDAVLLFGIFRVFN